MTPRFVVILGMGHCGSTVLSGLMANVPGVFPAGETHWMVDRFKGRSTLACTACGRKCEVFGKIDLDTLDDGNLYGRIVEAAGCRTLVTSDKAISYVKRFVKEGEAAGIVLYKRPEAQYASALRHDLLWHPRFSQVYQKWYSSILAWAAGHLSSHVVVSHERLSVEPQEQLEAICGALGLPAPRKPFRYPPEPWHNIGGNRRAWHEGVGGATIEPDLRWRSELSDEDVEQISADWRCRKTWETLEAKAL
jgi:hypothetical protein